MAAASCELRLLLISGFEVLLLLLALSEVYIRVTHQALVPMTEQFIDDLEDDYELTRVR